MNEELPKDVEVAEAGAPPQEAMPEIIEPMIGPITVKDVNAIMKNKQIEGSVEQAKFLQFGMPQLRLPIGRMSNPEIQKIMHTLRKDAQKKPNAAARRAAKIAKGKLHVVDGKLFGYEHQFVCGDETYGIDGKNIDPPPCDVSLRNIRDGLQEFAEVAKEKLAELELRNDKESRKKVEDVVRDLDPDFDWAALQRLRKSGEGLY